MQEPEPRKNTKVRRIVPALLLILFHSLTPVYGKDLAVLVCVLCAAFLAEDGAAMCLVPSIDLSAGDRALFIDAKGYSQTMKQKVSAGLSEEDTLFVLKSAADRAKADISEVIQVLKSRPPANEYTELYRWCTVNTKPIAEQIIGTYIRQPDVIDELIENAKRR